METRTFKNKKTGMIITLSKDWEEIFQENLQVSN